MESFTTRNGDLLCPLGQKTEHKEQYQERYSRSEVEHAHPGHYTAQGRQNRLRQLVDDSYKWVQRVGRGEPGEYRTCEDRDNKDDEEGLEYQENQGASSVFFAQFYRLFVGRYDGVANRGAKATLLQC